VIGISGKKNNRSIIARIDFWFMLDKKGRVYENIEKYSLLRSMKAIDRSDVCVIVIDAKEGIVEHDKHIAGYALDANKPVVLVVNKWDIVEDKEQAMKKWKNDIEANFQFMTFAKVVFLSALTKKSGALRQNSAV